MIEGMAVQAWPRTYARLAGFLYLIVIIGGAFAQAFVRQPLLVPGDPAGTARNIIANEQVYRFAFVESLIYLSCNVGLAVIFYRIFRPVQRDLALAVAFFTLLGTSIEGVNLFTHFAPLVVLRSETATSAFSPDQVRDLAYLSLRFFDVGFSASLVFFAFYDLIAGYLIYRSTFLPRAIGVFMMAGGLCYLINSLTYFLAPDVESALFPYILIPSLIGEASFCLWLLVRGVDVGKFAKVASG